jgi:YesN/AraC family two-component response regulator
MKKTVICIDDEEVVLNSLEMELSSADAEFEIETALGGEEAFELIAELTAEGADIAVVITDYIMPGMKGDELLTKVHQRYPAVSKILLTGQSQIEGVTNAINHADLYRFIEKPWQKEDLLLTIKGALGKYETEKKLREQQQVIDDLNARLGDNRIEMSDSKISEEQLFAHSLFAKFFKSLKPENQIWFSHACVGIMSSDGRITKNEMLYVNTLCTANPEKEYVYKLVNMLKNKEQPQLPNLSLSQEKALQMMLFFVQILTNDDRINQHEQMYFQHLGGRLNFTDGVINDFVKLAYRKIELLKTEKNLIIELTGKANPVG